MSGVFALRESFMNVSILQDHAAHPRHRREVLGMADVGHAANPLCADTFDVGVVVKNGIVVDVAFVGRGCALAVGSASLLCEYVRGKRVVDLAIEGFQHLGGEKIGRMREGCVRVSVIALYRAFGLAK